MPLSSRINRAAGPLQHADQTPASSPAPHDDEPIILPRIRQPGAFAENMPPYRSPCHSPVLVVQSPSRHLGSKHAEFSFESPPVSPAPDVTILPNRRDLAIRSMTTAPHDGSEGFEASVPQSPQVRSASSSYPSEGMRSPDLAASPPMTFGRRVLSSLEAYGFSSAHLSSFFQNSESSAQGFQSCDETRVASEDTPRPDVADNRIWDSLTIKGDPEKKPSSTEQTHLTDDVHHEREKTEIDNENNHPGRKSFDDLVRSISQDKAFKLPAGLKPPNSFPGRCRDLGSSPLSLMMNRTKGNVDSPNPSTSCLPRASGGMEETRAEDVDESLPQVEHCSQVSGHSSRLEKQFSSSDKRPDSSRRCSLRSRISHYFQLRQTVKVKKWILNGFSARRKGPRVVVKKVKEPKARFVFGGGSKASSSRGGSKTSTRGENLDLPAPLFHGGFYEDKRKSGSLSKSIRSIRKSVSGSLFGGGGVGGSVGSVAGATRAGSGVLAGRGRVGKSRFREVGSDARS